MKKPEFEGRTCSWQEFSDPPRELVTDLVDAFPKKKLSLNLYLHIRFPSQSFAFRVIMTYVALEFNAVGNEFLVFM